MKEGLSMVSWLSVAFIIMNMVLGIMIPLGMLIYFKKKYGIAVSTFFIGCGVMLIFALILEQIVHSVVLSSGLGQSIRNSIWLYALYGGLMAGLFEETGRLLAMKFVLKKKHQDPHNALMYGAGHGGFEAMIILCIGMLNNLIYALIINMGQTEVLMAPLDEANRQVLQNAFNTLISTSPWLFLASPIERLAAVTAQIALSVIVWFAATRKGKMHLYVLAVFLHFLLDASAVILSGLGVPLLCVEIVIWILAFIIAFIARLVWRKFQAEVQR